MSADTQPSVVWAECAKCSGKRRCYVRGHFQKSDSDEHVQWWADWKILQCCGCDYIFVQRSLSNSEEYDHVPDGKGDWDIEPTEEITHWPAIAKRKRPEWLSDFGIDAPNVEKLDQVMLELYISLDNDLHILSGIGIRTAFDVASEVLGIAPSQTFKEKLSDLVSNGHIRELDRDRIETLVDAGSASAHRGWKPKTSDLNLMAEILEHFIHDAFVAPARRTRLDAQAAKMKAGVPQRKPKPPKEPKAPKV